MTDLDPEKSSSGSRLGDDLVEAFEELAAYLRGEIEVESYRITDPDLLTPERVKAIRRKVAASTKEFEQRFQISARTMEAYEQVAGGPTRPCERFSASSIASPRPPAGRSKTPEA